MLDAYTVRKAIPRILIAVIGINLSYYLCLAAVDITNIIGGGIADLLVTPFLKPDTFGSIGIANDVATNTAAAGLFITALVGVGGLVWGGAALSAGLALLGMLVPLLITVGLITLAIMFTLIIRQALLIFLVIISPVAIALFVLPGTEKYFKQWLDLFIKTLVVYPIIAVLFAMSTVMGAILLGTADASPDGIGLAKIFGAIVVVFAPLVLIPFAFKLAGGAIGAVMNVANGRAGGFAARTNKGFDGWRRNPNSVVGRKTEAGRSKRIERGTTASQLWARRPGGGRSGARAQRIGAATELQRGLADSRTKETERMKLASQDSDIQESILMTDDMVANDKAMLARQVAAGKGNVVLNPDGSTALDSSGEAIKGISQEQYDRRMQAHAFADSIGRTASNQRAAFLNGDRIKFSSPTGVEGYEAELETAKRVFNNDNASVAAAMNAHQAIAAGVGRADLSSALYGEDASRVRSSSKAGASGILSGHSNGVRGALKDHIETINDSKASVQDRAQSAQFLANMLSSAQSPYGAGNEENKRLVLQQREEIQKGFKVFANDPSTSTSYLHQEMSAPSGVERTITLADGTRETRAVPGGKVSGAAAAELRLQRMSQAEIDPALASTAKPPGAGTPPPPGAGGTTP